MVERADKFENGCDLTLSKNPWRLACLTSVGGLQFFLL